MTDKEKVFCKEYIKDFNGANAARLAGYSENSAKEIAYENLTKLHIQKYIQELLKPKLDELDITVDSVLRDILEIKERCMQKVPVREYDKVSKEWIETGEWEFNASGALKATEQLGKYLKMFTDKVEHHTKIPGLEDIDNEKLYPIVINGSNTNN
jgi:phage terminase small subunit